jgi:hypothetical protein
LLSFWAYKFLPFVLVVVKKSLRSDVLRLYGADPADRVVMGVRHVHSPDDPDDMTLWDKMAQASAGGPSPLGIVMVGSKLMANSTTRPIL